MTLLGILGYRQPMRAFQQTLHKPALAFSGSGPSSNPDSPIDPEEAKEEARLTRVDRTPVGMKPSDTFWPSPEPPRVELAATLLKQADTWINTGLAQFQDKPKRSLLHLQKALEVAELAEGEKSVVAALAQSCIGWVYAQNNKPEEAFNYYNRALERYNAIEPGKVEAWRPATVHGMLATLMKQYQNWEQAESHLIEGLKWLQKGMTVPQNDATCVDLLGNLTRLRMEQNDYKGALVYAERGVEKAGKLPEASNTNYFKANALYLAGLAYARNKQPTIGLPLMEAGILIKKKHAGPQSPSLIPFLALYGDMLEATHDYRKADRIRQEADTLRDANDLALNGDDDPNPLHDD